MTERYRFRLENAADTRLNVWPGGALTLQNRQSKIAWIGMAQVLQDLRKNDMVAIKVAIAPIKHDLSNSSIKECSAD
jgi:hypothetical protein